MKLLRYGPKGREKPGMLDASGAIRDLSRVVKDIDGETLSPAGLKKLKALKPEKLKKIAGKPRLGTPVSPAGKLICVGPTRKVALQRAYRALSEYLVRGIKTTIPLHKAIMSDPIFIEGKATTAYMEDFMSRTPTDLF